jgi:hypothetical protein
VHTLDARSDIPQAAVLSGVSPSPGGGRAEGPGPSPSPPPPASSGSSWQVLGNNAAIAGQSVADAQKRRSEVRARQMELRRTMRRIAAGMCDCTDVGSDEHRKCWAERISRCELGRVASRVGIRVRQTDSYGRRASFTGLETCKSLSCPRCLGFIREGVAAKLADVAKLWSEAGNAALYAVLSVPHAASDRLADMHKAEAEAWRRITSSRQWKELRQVTGLEYLRTTEITHGAEHGFHPHLNVYLVSPTMEPLDFAVKVIPVINRLWRKECARHGFPALSAEHGVRVDIVQSPAVAEYITKDWGIGKEMLRGDLKRGRGSNRTFLEVLSDYRQSPDEADRLTIEEFARGTRGRRMLTTSRGFWQLMATVGVEEPSEDDLADDTADVGEVEELGYLPAEVWERVARKHKWGLAAEVLTAAELGGVDAVVRLLARHKEFLVDSRDMPIWPSRAGPRKAGYVQMELAS